MLDGNLMITFLTFGGMFALMYFLIIVPDKKRRKKYASMIDSIKVNDEITTKGGIIGKVVNMKDNYIILESGPDRSRIKMLKTGVFTINATVEENVE